MKKTLFYWSIILLLMFFCLISCKSPQWHLNQFKKKGGKINCISDTIQVLDTLVINGDTIYHWRPKIVVKDSIHYLTKYELKYKYKTDKSNNKLEEKKAKEETKQNRSDNSVEKVKERQENKTERAKLIWWIWLIIGWLLGIITIIIVCRKIPFK